MIEDCAGMVPIVLSISQWLLIVSEFFGITYYILVAMVTYGCSSPLN